jgi:hypothetical protein
MLLSLPALSREGFSVNAHGCRQYPEALSLLSGLLRAHDLPRLVVIALGANGQIENGEIEQALHILGPDRLLVLVSPRELGGSSGADAQLVRAEGKRHPGRVVVLDWVSFSAAHPDWFQPDGLHLTLGGAAAFAQLIGRVQPLASLPKSLRAPKCTTPTPTPTPSPGPAPPAGVRSAARLAPAAPLRGIAAVVRGGALDMHPGSPELRLSLTNANPFPVAGIASLRLLDDTRPTIAASCISIPPQGSAPLTLRLDAQALAAAELLGRYKVQLALAFSGPEGDSATLSSTYLLRRT